MFHVGQRWFSEGEPELGLGIVAKLEDRTVIIHYPLGDENRIYNAKSCPLKRFTLAADDELFAIDEQTYQVTAVQEQNGILFYLCGEQIIPEMDLHPKLDLGGPLQRLLAKNFDSSQFYLQRYQAALYFRKYQEFKHKGFLSAKIRLLPHQVYVVHEVLAMPEPKVMLCDEVGLGKTIEASLVLNALIQEQLIDSALIVLPESLMNQWFVELYKKFNLSFAKLEEIDSQEELDNTRFCMISSQTLKEDPVYQDYIKQKGWGMLIIDESHQFNFAQAEDAAISCLSQVNEQAYATLFLSATPEVLGVKNLYEQLHFLDPLKFQSFDDFKQMLDRSKSISQLVTHPNFDKNLDEVQQFFTADKIASFSDNDALKQALIDRYGTGRNYFRNSRKNLEKYSKLFNKRCLHAYGLNVSGNINDQSVLKTKLATVYEIIQKYPEQKILIICHAKNVVLSLYKKLQDLGNFKMASFHSEQSLLERDRQAAYFADEEGAQILISTEVGSEGRNFEFAHHLVLFDLPKLPDQLEQRIGRLDRIGQTQDINIHIPYINHTFEEILFKWYHQVFNGFQSSPIGSNEYYERNKNGLKQLIEQAYDESIVSKFMEDHKSQYQTYKQELEQGRDHLIELNSYNDTKAKEIIEAITKFEQEQSPKSFIEGVFESIGIKHEELNDKSYYLAPTDNMLIPSYPGLGMEGFSVSYEREYSQRFDNLQMMSWEHPVVKNAFELMLNSPLGNCCASKQAVLPRNIYFEFILGLYCSDEFKHLGALYLPYTPLRVLLNIQGEDLTKKYPKKHIDENLLEIHQEDAEIMSQIPKDSIQELYKKAQNLAQKKQKQFSAKAIEKLEQTLDIELMRVQNLDLEEELKTQTLNYLKLTKSRLEQTLQNPTMAVDSIRILLPES